MNSKIDRAAALALPQNIYLGTSSWTYPGWKGLVYQKDYRNDKVFKSDSLEEYCQFPWFRTVGIDSTFYGPPRVSTLQRYASQVPLDFKWVSKVWEEITVPRYANHKRYGKKAGLENLNFLNADLFKSSVLQPYIASGTEKYCGPFVFQFQMFDKSITNNPSGFFDRLSSFLQALPKDFLYATELRNPELLTPEYFSLLNSHGATHCFNHWTYMPRISDQMRSAATAGGLTADFYVARILTPLNVSYQQAVKRFSPYTQILEPIPEMRKDLVRVAKRAMQRNSSAFVIVNNRSEGNSPLTIDSVGRMIVEELSE